MLEIERDRELDDAQKKELLRRLYALLWRRAKGEFEHTNDAPSPTPHAS